MTLLLLGIWDLRIRETKYIEPWPGISICKPWVSRFNPLSLFALLSFRDKICHGSTSGLRMASTFANWFCSLVAVRKHQLRSTQGNGFFDLQLTIRHGRKSRWAETLPECRFLAGCAWTVPFASLYTLRPPAKSWHHPQCAGPSLSHH